ncbi:MAG: hypothetical protein IPP14_08540 [Planctomycetes bacterium]|nr:hypothetical protein [Planctomycetota bacterium]
MAKKKAVKKAAKKPAKKLAKEGVEKARQKGHQDAGEEASETAIEKACETVSQESGLVAQAHKAQALSPGKSPDLGHAQGNIHSPAHGQGLEVFRIAPRRADLFCIQ